MAVQRVEFVEADSWCVIVCHCEDTKEVVDCIVGSATALIKDPFGVSGCIVTACFCSEFQFIFVSSNHLKVTLARTYIRNDSRLTFASKLFIEQAHSRPCEPPLQLSKIMLSSVACIVHKGHFLESKFSLF